MISVYGTDPLDLLSVRQTQVITHTPVLMRKTTCNESRQQLLIYQHLLEEWKYFSHFEADSPQGPRSAEPCSSQTAWRAAVLSGGFKLNFLINFLPYRERGREGGRETLTSKLVLNLRNRSWVSVFSHTGFHAGNKKPTISLKIKTQL